MSATVSLSGSFRVSPSAVDEFRELVAEIAEVVRGTLPDTLVYEWFLSEDGSRAWIYERFRDADAMDAHERLFGERFAARLMGLVELVEVAVLGPASAAQHEAMSSYAAFAPLIVGVDRH